MVFLSTIRQLRYEYLNYVGLEVLTVMTANSTVFWDVTPCRPVQVSQRFAGTVSTCFLWTACFDALCFSRNAVNYQTTWRHSIVYLYYPSESLFKRSCLTCCDGTCAVARASLNDLWAHTDPRVAGQAETWCRPEVTYCLCSGKQRQLVDRMCLILVYCDCRRLVYRAQRFTGS